MSVLDRDRPKFFEQLFITPVYLSFWESLAEVNPVVSEDMRLKMLTDADAGQ